MAQVLHDNVGALDAAVRVLLGVLALAGAASTYVVLTAEWGLVTWIHGAILAAYLLLTAAVRQDPVYYLVGWDTVGGRARRRAAAGRPARAR